jgi:hypothetical protein
MAEFQTLRQGRFEFEIGAEDRRLLHELALQKHERRRRHSRSPASMADLLIPWMKAWCRRPRRLARVGIEGQPVRVDCRTSFPQERVCQEFASKLIARGEKNLSAVLRAIVREYIEPRRGELKAAAAEREAAAAERERRERRAAKQRQYRARFDQDGVADAIELFLPELGEHYKRRAVEQLDRDARALTKLGLLVADHFAAVMNAKERLNPHPRAVDEKRQFADDLVRVLGFALAQPSETRSLSELGSTGRRWQSRARPSGS